MTTQTLRRLKAVDVEAILDDLTCRQFVAPHKPVDEVLTELASLYGLTLACVNTAAERLSLDTARSVGRLLRAEIIQLSQAVHRAHRHTLLERSGTC